MKDGAVVISQFLLFVDYKRAFCNNQVIVYRGSNMKVVQLILRMSEMFIGEEPFCEYCHSLNEVQRRCSAQMLCVKETFRTFNKSKLYSALMLSRKNLLVLGARAEIFLLPSHRPLHLPLPRIPRVRPPRPQAVREARRVCGGTVVLNPRASQGENKLEFA